jgi:WD40 repeat protein
LIFRGHNALWDVQTSFSPEGQWLAVTTNLITPPVTTSKSPTASRVVNRTAVYRAGTRQLIANVPGHPFVFGPAGMLATKTSDSGITIWKILPSGAKEQLQLVAPTKLLSSFAFSQEKTLFAARSATNQIFLWDLQFPSRPRIIQRPWLQQDGGLLFSHDGRTLVVGHSSQGVLEYWNTATLQLSRSVRVNHPDTQALALSPDGRTLAAMGPDHTLWLWDYHSGEKLKELRGTKEWMGSLAFSPDGRTLAAAGADGALKLYNLSCGAQVAALSAHKSACRAVSFSAEGTWLASAGVDNTIKLWYAPTFEELDRR